MEKKTLFTETQRFNQYWIWALLIAVTAVSVYVWWTGEAPEEAKDYLVRMIPLLINVAVVWLFMVMRLETEIGPEGIRVRFFPFHWTFRSYHWSDLKSAQVRRYNALFEYGGWGLRGLGKDRAMIVSGVFGMQLVTNKGAKLLIGTRKPEEAGAVISEYGLASDSLK